MSCMLLSSPWYHHAKPASTAPEKSASWPHAFLALIHDSLSVLLACAQMRINCKLYSGLGCLVAGSHNATCRAHAHRLCIINVWDLP